MKTWCSFIVDWRNYQHGDQPAAKKSKSSTFEEFYNNLKDSIKINDAVSEEFKEEDYKEPPENSQKCLTRINNLSIIIKAHTRIHMKYYYIMGSELAYAKFFVYCVKCNAHLNETVIYIVLSCKTCTDNNKQGISKFFKDIEKSVNYSKTHINFLIRISKLCKLYPKFKFNCTPLEAIKNNMKNLEPKMKEDSEFWNSE